MNKEGIGAVMQDMLSEPHRQSFFKVWTDEHHKEMQFQLSKWLHFKFTAIFKYIYEAKKKIENPAALNFVSKQGFPLTHTHTHTHTHTKVQRTYRIHTR